MSNISNHPEYSHYEFNRDGLYRKAGAGSWLKGKPIYNGYYTAYLCGNGDLKGMTKFMHRIVWEAFYGKIDKDMEVDHIDKNPANNSLSNLRCLTKSEHKKTRDHSFIKKMVAERKQRERKIKSREIEGGEEKVFANKSRTARFYGCSPALIYAVCEGRAKTFGGAVTFSYTDDDITQQVPRKQHKRKYNTEEERKEARRGYAKKYREKRLAKKD
jgi:hypothetical protein